MDGFEARGPDDRPAATTGRWGLVRTVLRRIVLGAFAVTVTLIALLLGEVALSLAGLTFDPHGYTVIFGVVLAAVLTPVALALWLLHQLLRGRRLPDVGPGHQR